MHPKFAEAVERLHPSFVSLVSMAPHTAGSLPREMPKSGVYLFSEGANHLYVGRSRNMRNRYGLHTRRSAPHNQASFAFLLAKEALGIEGASYKSDHLSRQGLSSCAEFIEAFVEAKTRVRKMDFRFVEEVDNTRQALLEIYCSVALGTPYNDFRTH